MEMPSETPMVLNRIPIAPVRVTPSLTRSPSWLRCMLQGLPSYQTDPMPTCGLLRSSIDRPVAMSMACDAPWLAGWGMRGGDLLSMGLLVGREFYIVRVNFDER